MHIGLIGGIGPAATKFYYHQLAHAHAVAGRRMDLTIVHVELGDLMQNMAAGAPEQQARIFLDLARRLQAAGAHAVAVASIAGHFCITELARACPLPIIDAIPALDAELRRRGLARVGILGTRVVMDSRLYGGISSVDMVVPQGDRFDAVQRAYVALAAAGRATAEQRALFFAVGQELCRQQGAEAVVLGGTDLFLAFDGHDCGFPVIDSARVHSDALYRASVDADWTESAVKSTCPTFEAM